MVEPDSVTEGWLTQRTQPRSRHIVILDNGLIEKGQPDPDSLLRVAERVHPHEVICPDLMYDADGTVALFREYAESCAGVCKRVMIVPQGNSLPEWMNCLERLVMTASELQINIQIGVTKLLDKHDGGRYTVLPWLAQYMRRMEIWHPVHLLGIWAHLAEISRLLSEFPDLIRGVDSTFPYASTINHGWVTSWSPKKELIPEQWEEDPSIVQRMKAALNIALCEHLIGVRHDSLMLRMPSRGTLVR
jgi:hypothetical protein